MVGFEVEGLRAMGIYIGMVIGSGLLVWLVSYFSKYFDFGFKLVKPMLSIAKMVTEFVIKDPKKQKEVNKWTEFIEQGVLIVEHRKKEIDAANPDATPEQLKEIYREQALKIAEELAASQGILKPDVLTSTIANALLEAIINFLPDIKREERVTYIDLKTAQDK
jgi:hypothetical protein